MLEISSVPYFLRRPTHEQTKGSVHSRLYRRLPHPTPPHILAPQHQHRQHQTLMPPVDAPAALEFGEEGAGGLQCDVLGRDAGLGDGLGGVKGAGGGLGEDGECVAGGSVVGS